MKILYIYGAFALFATGLLNLSAAPAVGQKPNIILILADDLGYRELGCYGQQKILTPHIDQLATEGMKFTQAYSGSGVCAPSRCVLMTGKHPGHAFVRDNGGSTLPASEGTFVEILQSIGYATGGFGKWGLGGSNSTGHPLEKGFDHFFGYLSQGRAHSYYPSYLDSDNGRLSLTNNPPLKGSDQLDPSDDPNDPQSYARFKGTDYAPDRIHDEVLSFIRDNKDTPFFCYYPTIIPHLALHIPDEDLKPYLEKQWPETPFTGEGKGYHYTPHQTPRAAYAAMISRLDQYVGNVMALLKELDLDKNTLVIFTSDNGTSHTEGEVDYTFFNSVGELRGLKATIYEGGVRVPMIARWPDKITPGTVDERVVGFEDFMPTLTEIAGISDLESLETDGISFLPTLLSTEQSERPFLYREFRKHAFVRVGDWKSYLSNKNELRLYNLTTDISEGNNVSREYPEISAKLREIMAKQHEIPSNEKHRIKNLEKVAVTAKGTPHWWLDLYGLTNGTFNAEDLLDVDGDGLAAWEEYIAGTLPNSSSSSLVVDCNTDPTDKGYIISWPSVEERFYNLQRGTNLVNGLETITLGGIPATPPENTYTDTTQNVEAFYRVEAYK